MSNKADLDGSFLIIFEFVYLKKMRISDRNCTRKLCLANRCSKIMLAILAALHISFFRFSITDAILCSHQRK